MAEDKEEVENYVSRIAAKGRAAGVHLIVATQVPYTSVITGKIKYNLQTKICLKTDTHIHSQTIIGVKGGERLLGRGDAYLRFEDTPELIRAQTPYVSDNEIWELITKRTV